VAGGAAVACRAGVGYGDDMARTHIELDDDLLELAKRLYPGRSEKELLELALRHLVEEPLSREEALAMKGTGWDGDLDELRGPGTAP
jgi:Arc/MetJ family transcription regulator